MPWQTFSFHFLHRRKSVRKVNYSLKIGTELDAYLKNKTKNFEITHKIGRVESETKPSHLSKWMVLLHGCTSKKEKKSKPPISSDERNSKSFFEEVSVKKMIRSKIRYKLEAYVR